MAYRISNTTRALGCALMLLIFVLAPMGIFFGGPYTHTIPQPFDSARWKLADSSSTERCAMLLDLEFRIGLAGRTRSEVIGLLGQPDGNQTNKAVSAWLLCPSLIDIWILEVRWEHGRVGSAWVRDT